MITVLKWNVHISNYFFFASYKNWILTLCIAGGEGAKQEEQKQEQCQQADQEGESQSPRGLRQQRHAARGCRQERRRRR